MKTDITKRGQQLKLFRDTLIFMLYDWCMKTKETETTQIKKKVKAWHSGGGGGYMNKQLSALTLFLPSTSSEHKQIRYRRQQHGHRAAVRETHKPLNKYRLVCRGAHGRSGGPASEPPCIASWCRTSGGVLRSSRAESIQENTTGYEAGV